jgi:hypothetical protein
MPSLIDSSELDERDSLRKSLSPDPRVIDERKIFGTVHQNRVT